MFDGSFRTAKRVALGGASKDKSDRASLLEQARKDREERSRRRAETRSVSLIQVRPFSDLRSKERLGTFSLVRVFLLARRDEGDERVEPLARRARRTSSRARRLTSRDGIFRYGARRSSPDAGRVALEPRAVHRTRGGAFAVAPKTRRRAGGARALAGFGRKNKQPRGRARVLRGASFLRRSRARVGRRPRRARVRVVVVPWRWTLGERFGGTRAERSGRGVAGARLRGNALAAEIPAASRRGVGHGRRLGARDAGRVADRRFRAQRARRARRGCARRERGLGARAGGHRSDGARSALERRFRTRPGSRKKQKQNALRFAARASSRRRGRTVTRGVCASATVRGDGEANRRAMDPSRAARR